MNDMGASGVIAASIGGMWLAQVIGLPTPSAVEYIQGMAIGVLGAFGWQFIKTQRAREEAAAKGVKSADLPRVDLYTLGAAMLGAPFSTSLMIWVIHTFGGTAQSYLSFGLFLGAGAAGPQFVPAIVAFIGALPSRLFPASGGPKP